MLTQGAVWGHIQVCLTHLGEAMGLTDLEVTISLPLFYPLPAFIIARCQTLAKRASIVAVANQPGKLG
eukprot:scaffold129687_cov20-Tisochrysis_lutea.AAC.4